MSYIQFRNINKYFGEQHVLKNLNLSVERGQFVTLLGPSGCGKSTLLRLLAGLENLSDGSILLDGEDITNKNPRLRNIGMIFQQYSLFPTMNVYYNVAFGLKMKHLEKELIEQAVSEALRMVNLSGSEKKYPSQLSGGEQQRVALARCIVTRPKVLLLDEPFSAIDAKLRKSLQSRIKEIHKELRMTSIFVTHDQDEAMTMSDTIHLLNNGLIEQTASPMELYKSPKTMFAASFMGNYNIMDPEGYSRISGRSGYDRTVAIRPELIRLSKEPFAESGDVMLMSGRVADRIPQGNIIRYRISVGDECLTVDVLFSDEIFYEIGETVHLAIRQEDVIEY